MNIGTLEILVILIVGLVVLGPEKAPYYAKKTGKALTDLKAYSKQLTDDINETIIEPLEEAKAPLNEVKASIQNPIQDLQKNIKDIGKDLNPTTSKVKTQEVVAADAVQEIKLEKKEEL
ncbi:MAG: Sec-independent protein translocase subunit TatA/TatB [Erysipelotrichaceae bacterium]